MLSSGELTEDDSTIIAAWIRQVTYYGPESIQGDNKWSDHELEDEWVGYRSSAFSNRGRIIYRVSEQEIKILISRITATHDYRKNDNEKK